MAEAPPISDSDSVREPVTEPDSDDGRGSGDAPRPPVDPAGPPTRGPEDSGEPREPDG